MNGGWYPYYPIYLAYSTVVSYVGELLYGGWYTIGPRIVASNVGELLHEWKMMSIE